LHNPSAKHVALWGWDFRGQYDSVKSDSRDYVRLNGTSDAAVIVAPNGYMSIDLPFRVNFTTGISRVKEGEMVGCFYLFIFERCYVMFNLFILCLLKLFAHL
jgi:hypothetical protein